MTRQYAIEQFTDVVQQACRELGGADPKLRVTTDDMQAAITRLLNKGDELIDQIELEDEQAVEIRTDHFGV